jgi:hypothetical protein
VWPASNPTGPATSGRTPNPWLIGDEDGWQRAPVDNGQWGDRVWIEATTTDPTTGRFYAIVDRWLRATPDDCFVDHETCYEREIALVTSPDGQEWHDVATDTWSIDPESYDRNGLLWDAHLLASGDGSLMIWQGEVEGGVTIHRWTGPDLPPLIDPPGYDEPPPFELELYIDGPIEIGESFRFELPLDGCGSGATYVDGVWWEPTPALHWPLPEAWPARFLGAADGPTGYALGTITRISGDSLTFSVADVGEVVTLTPASGDAGNSFCG